MQVLKRLFFFSFSFLFGNCSIQSRIFFIIFVSFFCKYSFLFEEKLQITGIIIIMKKNIIQRIYNLRYLEKAGDKAALIHVPNHRRHWWKYSQLQTFYNFDIQLSKSCRSRKPVKEWGFGCNFISLRRYINRNIRCNVCLYGRLVF